MVKDLVDNDLNIGDNCWFKEGDWTSAISPFTLIKII